APYRFISMNYEVIIQWTHALPSSSSLESKQCLHPARTTHCKVRGTCARLPGTSGGLRLTHSWALCVWEPSSSPSRLFAHVYTRRGFQTRPEFSLLFVLSKTQSTREKQTTIISRFTCH